jgi:NAD(P)-dependent dehydrogenase (short-subunit alcohol dehydrogenase family)
MNKYTPNLSNKVVVITGGAGVLGSTLTKACAHAGAKVAIIGRNLDKAQQLANTLKNEGYKAFAVSCECFKSSKHLEEAHRADIKTLGSC